MKMPKLHSDLSQTCPAERRYIEDAPCQVSGASKDHEIQSDIEAIFRAQYERIVHVITRVVRDPARAEELAVEVFLKLWSDQQTHGEKTNGWLYRVALRMGLDELRRQTRKIRCERFWGFGFSVRTPEEIRTTTEEQERVRLVLSIIHRRHAELLLLRSEDLSYEEIASALGLNPGSIGTLLIRAQQAFRKEYVERYGEE
jgi:RNA polymerase sigma-70 factor, ECF subfamily